MPVGLGLGGAAGAAGPACFDPCFAFMASTRARAAAILSWMFGSTLAAGAGGRAEEAEDAEGREGGAGEFDPEPPRLPAGVPLPDLPSIAALRAATCARMAAMSSAAFLAGGGPSSRLLMMDCCWRMGVTSNSSG
jgi:hypothetical protein